MAKTLTQAYSEQLTETFWTFKAPPAPPCPPCYIQEQWDTLSPGFKREIIRQNPMIGRDLFNAMD